MIETNYTDKTGTYTIRNGCGHMVPVQSIVNSVTCFCEFCEETVLLLHEDGQICRECAELLAKRADHSDHINACDW